MPRMTTRSAAAAKSSPIEEVTPRNVFKRSTRPPNYPAARAKCICPMQKPEFRALYEALISRRRRTFGLPPKQTPQMSRHAVDKFRQMILRDSEKDIKRRLGFLHPAYRQFMRRRFYPKRLRSARASANPRTGLLRAALRIKRRILTVSPMPRVPLFQCAWCTSSSDVYQKILEHTCSVKRVKEKPALKMEEVRSFLRAGKCPWINDIYALLESLSNPQCVRMREAYNTTHLTLERICYNPRTHYEMPKQAQISEMPKQAQISDAYDSANEKANYQRDHDLDADSGFITGTPSPQGSLSLEENAPKSGLSETSDGSATDVNERFSRSMNGVGYYCSPCSRIFSTYAQYDTHLARSFESETACARTSPDPMEIQLSISDYLPESGRLITLPSEKENAPKPRRFECSKCRRNDFAEAGDLHEHIFICALN